MVRLPRRHFMRQDARMNLARIRQERGLSQRALADMIGMDPATVNRAEKMAATAKLSTYVACAKALGVTLSDIFGEYRSPREAALLEAFRRIPEERHDELLGLIRLAASHGQT